MTKLREQRTGFTAGEVDPLLHGRTDLKDYFAGASQCSNWALLVQGGLMDRPGTRFTVDLGANKGRLIEYIFADGQEYLIYLTNAAIAIYRDDGTVCTVTGSVAWTAADLAAIEFDSAGDTTILTHPNYPMKKLVRTGATTFTIADYAFETTAVQPFFKFAATSVTLTPSATTGNITCTASANAFTASHVGGVIRYGKKRINVTGFTSATVISGTVVDTLGGTAASTDWDEQVFSAAQGYARAVAFHEDRLWFGGSLQRPVAIWGSKVGAYYNFDTGTALDTEAIEKNLTFKRAKQIRHLQSAEHLIIYTDGGEVYAPKPTDKILTPGNCNFRWQTPYGSAFIKPRDLDGAAIFVQRTQKAVRDFQYDDVQLKYLANALSLRSTHLLTGPVDLAVIYGTDTRPEQYAVVVNADGSLAVLHILRTEKLAGWVPWTTDGKFVSVASTFDELFCVVERVINGATKYYLEKFDWSLTVDCAKTIDLGAPGTTFTGLAHLQAKSVAVVSGNSTVYMGAKTVAGGQITIDEPRQKCDIGLNYTCTYKPLPPDGALANGPITTEMRRISFLAVIFSSTVTFTVNGQVKMSRDATDDMSLDPVPKTGVFKFEALGYDRRPVVTLTRDVPLRMYLIGLTIGTDL